MFDRGKLRKFIEEKGYKQKVIAQKANITEHQFSLILQGKRKCDIDEYVRICVTLEVPFTEFIDEEKLSEAVKRGA